MATETRPFSSITPDECIALVKQLMPNKAKYQYQAITYPEGEEEGRVWVSNREYVAFDKANDLIALSNLGTGDSFFDLREAYEILKFLEGLNLKMKWQQ